MMTTRQQNIKRALSIASELKRDSGEWDRNIMACVNESNAKAEAAQRRRANGETAFADTLDECSDRHAVYAVETAESIRREVAETRAWFAAHR